MSLALVTTKDHADAHVLCPYLWAVLSPEPCRYEWPGLPPEAMVMFGSMSLPKAMSGSKAPLQSGSVLMFETQVTNKALWIHGLCCCWGPCLDSLTSHLLRKTNAHLCPFKNKRLSWRKTASQVSTFYSTVIQKPEFANILFIVMSTNVYLLTINYIYQYTSVHMVILYHCHTQKSDKPRRDIHKGPSVVEGLELRLSSPDT